MIIGAIKSFEGAVTFDYVMDKMSYANVIAYSASLPSYIPKDQKGKKTKKVEGGSRGLLQTLKGMSNG